MTGSKGVEMASGVAIAGMAALGIVLVVAAGAAAVALRRSHVTAGAAKAAVAVAGRARPRRGPAGPNGGNGPDGPAGQAGSAGAAAFAPADTLFVAKSWTPVGVDPTVYFTTITAAVAAAGASAPTSSLPWQIVIFPGIYSAGEAGTIFIPPNVHLFAPCIESVTIVPGVVLNTAGTSAVNAVTFTQIVFAGDMTINTTTGSPPPTAFTFTNCAFHAASDPNSAGGNISLTTLAADSTLFSNTRFNSASVAVSGGATRVECVGCDVVAETLAVNGTSTLILRSGATLQCPVVSVNNAADLTMEAMTVDAAITVSGRIVATNCTFGASSSLSLLTGSATAILDGSQITPAQVTAAGTASANFSLETLTFNTLVNGTAAPSYPVPYGTAPSVFLTQVNTPDPSTGTFPPVVTGEATTGFTVQGQASVTSYSALISTSSASIPV